MEVYSPKCGSSESLWEQPNMYDHLKPILKIHPEFLILHIVTNDTSKYTPNEIVDRVLALKIFIVAKSEQRMQSYCFNINNACS